MGTRDIDRDLERLIPATGFSDIIGAPLSPLQSDTPSGASPPSHHSGREALVKVIRSWASKKFITGCVILSPIAITFYVTWWFIQLGDVLFSPIYVFLGINIFGLGFITSITFIFLVGVFMSSWLGTSLLSLGEFIIKKMPLMSYIYTASKQISAAISPGQGSHAFKEVAIIKHPSVGEYAFGFITSTVILQKATGTEELCCVYVPTNHLYLGDMVLVNSKDIMKPNISVREGIEIIISGGMSIPKILTTNDSQHLRSPRIGKFVVPHV
ncbi:protein LIKE COV 3-like [Cynara cardunculus var. scolymus]|nr:protein LIKE COV 3-like [Cynara cardunculus var. scolymus]